MRGKGGSLIELSVISSLLLLTLVLKPLNPWADVFLPLASGEALQVCCGSRDPDAIVSLDARGNLSLDGERIPLADLADHVAGRRSVVVKADWRLAYADVRPVLQALKSRGIPYIGLAAAVR